MLERCPRRPAQRRSRTGRAPGASTPALALAGLLAGSGQTTQAKQPAPVAQAAPVATASSSSGGLIVVDAGRFAGQTTPENARRDGLTVVDLSDDWLPYILSEAPDKPQPLRPYLIDLANGRMRPGSAYARPREDRFFEAFGISPSLNLLRRRLADSKRHACHEKVKDAVLEELSPKNVIPPEQPEKIPNPDPKTVGETPMILTGRTISPRPLTALEKRAVVAMQAHLRCEDLLAGKANGGRMDRRTAAGLQIYQRLHMIADNASIDLETRTVLLGDSREYDFRALLRALRERVVDATGLLEDGSALGVLGQVQGRVLDNAEFRPLPVEAGSTQAPAQAPSTPSEPGKVTPAPDLIAAATQAASQALGWTSPEAVLASTLVLHAAPPLRRDECSATRQIRPSNSTPSRSTSVRRYQHRCGSIHLRSMGKTVARPEVADLRHKDQVSRGVASAPHIGQRRIRRKVEPKRERSPQNDPSARQVRSGYRCHRVRCGRGLVWSSAGTDNQRVGGCHGGGDAT